MNATMDETPFDPETDTSGAITPNEEVPLEVNRRGRRKMAAIARRNKKRMIRSKKAKRRLRKQRRKQKWKR
jgi:LAS superfamily LD-carboxypeptidase LdcB